MIDTSTHPVDQQNNSTADHESHSNEFDPYMHWFPITVVVAAYIIFIIVQINNYRNERKLKKSPTVLANESTSLNAVTSDRKENTGYSADLTSNNTTTNL